MGNENARIFTKRLMDFAKELDETKGLINRKNRDFIINTLFVGIYSVYERTLIDILGYFSSDEQIKEHLSKIKILMSPKKGDKFDFNKIFITNHPASILKILIFENDNIKNLEADDGAIKFNQYSSTIKSKASSYGSCLFNLEKDMHERRNALVHRSVKIDARFLKKITTIRRDDEYLDYMNENKLNVAENQDIMTETYLNHISLRIFDLFMYYILKLSSIVNDKLIETYFSDLLEFYLFRITSMQESGRCFTPDEKKRFYIQTGKTVTFFKDNYDMDKIDTEYLLENICSYYYIDPRYKEKIHPEVQKLLNSHYPFMKRSYLGQMAYELFSRQERKCITAFQKFIDRDVTDDIINNKFIFTHMYSFTEFKRIYKKKFKRAFSQDRTIKHKMIKSISNN